MNRLQQLLTQEVNVMLNFKDKDQISDYAKAHVERAIDFGIMNGIGDNLFDPKSPVTREQAAVIASNIIRYITGK